LFPVRLHRSRDESARDLVNAPLGDVAGDLLDDPVRHQGQAKWFGQPRFQTQLVVYQAVLTARPEDRSAGEIALRRERVNRRFRSYRRFVQQWRNMQRLSCLVISYLQVAVYPHAVHTELQGMVHHAKLVGTVGPDQLDVRQIVQNAVKVAIEIADGRDISGKAKGLMRRSGDFDHGYGT